MSWSIGFDDKWQRDIGYGVPCTCDHPRCNEKIDRGLSYVCGGDVYGGENGCGYSSAMLTCNYTYPRAAKGDSVKRCPRCASYKKPYKPKPDIQEWLDWKAADPSWEKWHEEQKAKATET